MARTCDKTIDDALVIVRRVVAKSFDLFFESAANTPKAFASRRPLTIRQALGTIMPLCGTLQTGFIMDALAGA